MIMDLLDNFALSRRSFIALLLGLAVSASGYYIYQEDFQYTKTTCDACGFAYGGNTTQIQEKLNEKYPDRNLTVSQEIKNSCPACGEKELGKHLVLLNGTEVGYATGGRRDTEVTLYINDLS